MVETPARRWRPRCRWSASRFDVPNTCRPPREPSEDAALCALGLGSGASPATSSRLRARDRRLNHSSALCNLYQALSVELTRGICSFDIVSLDDPCVAVFAGGRFLSSLDELGDAAGRPLNVSDFVPSFLLLGLAPAALSSSPRPGSAMCDSTAATIGSSVPSDWTRHELGPPRLPPPSPSVGNMLPLHMDSACRADRKPRRRHSYGSSAVTERSFSMSMDDHN